MINRFSKLQIDLEHKIEDSEEKTRNEFRGTYNSSAGISSSVEMINGDNSWED